MRAWHIGQHTHREDLEIKVACGIAGKNFPWRGGTDVLNYHAQACAINAVWGGLLRGSLGGRVPKAQCKGANRDEVAVQRCKGDETGFGCQVSGIRCREGQRQCKGAKVQKCKGGGRDTAARAERGPYPRQDARTRRSRAPT